MSYPDYGSFQLDSVEGLPNIKVAFPGEHWSDGKANETITPGELVVPTTASAGRRRWARAASGAVDPRAAVALRCIEPPDRSQGGEYSTQLGPNEITSRDLVAGDYVHAYRSGGFVLTLFAADTYNPGDLLAWDPGATAQTGKTSYGTGAWEKTATAANAFFEVREFKPLPGETDRGVLYVTSLRTQA